MFFFLSAQNQMLLGSQNLPSPVTCGECMAAIDFTSDSVSESTTGFNLKSQSNMA